MDLIRCNATSPANCKWITLTYREEMTDCKRVFKDNKAFLRKLRSYLKKQKLAESKTDFMFIAVAEPQGENHGNALAESKTNFKLIVVIKSQGEEHRNV